MLSSDVMVATPLPSHLCPQPDTAAHGSGPPGVILRYAIRLLFPPSVLQEKQFGAESGTVITNTFPFVGQTAVARDGLTRSWAWGCPRLVFSSLTSWPQSRSLSLLNPRQGRWRGQLRPSLARRLAWGIRGG